MVTALLVILGIMMFFILMAVVGAFGILTFLMTNLNVLVLGAIIGVVICLLIQKLKK